MTPGTSIGFYVGGEECCGNFFHGEVKSLRVWKRVLTETEIKDNYANEHKYHDSSGVGCKLFEIITTYYQLHFFEKA